jgi:hypothetical protein
MCVCVGVVVLHCPDSTKEKGVVVLHCPDSTKEFNCHLTFSALDCC